MSSTDPNAPAVSANATARATLSLCMIARDAERSLAEALQSARPFMDEMVVVDTGSRDQTPDVARQLGAKLDAFPWCDDFSAARNHSLEQATGDWIFWMDADDSLPAESGQELRRLVGEHPDRHAAFWVTVEQELTGDDGRSRRVGHAQLKLFPRHPAIRFCYRVHEQVAPAIQRLGMALKPSQAIVRHRRSQCSWEAETARMSRNLRLLELDLAERPDDPVVLLNLGMTNLYWPERRLQAIEYLRRSLSGFKPGSSTRLNAYLLLAEAYSRAGERDRELRTCLEASEHFPRDAVLLLRLGRLYEHGGELKRAASCYQTLLESGTFRLGVIHPRDLHAQAAVRLGQILRQVNEPERARLLWQRFLERYPQEQSIHAALAELHAIDKI